MVGLGGLEPPTSRLSSARSNQLSYKPVATPGKSSPSEAKPRKRDCASRLMPRPRGAPAPEGCDAARERDYFIHEERETKAAGPALCMRDGQVTPCPSLFQVFQKAEAKPKPGVSIEKHP